MSFPEVEPEPTSYAPFHPNVEDVDCPECGGDGFLRQRSGGIGYYFCRECRTGKDSLYRQANYGSDWGRVRDWVLDRCGEECRACGAGGEIHIHHIEKLIWFETTEEAHTPENLIGLCPDCHDELENEPERCRSLLGECSV